MKTSLRDPLLIAIAMLTILGCGFGLGRFSPESETAAPTPQEVPLDSLLVEMERSLEASLGLSDTQLDSLRPELASFSAEVFDTRRRALIDYYFSLLRFHDQIAPKLNADQQEILKRNRELLADEIAQRFPNHPPPPTNNP